MQIKRNIALIAGFLAVGCGSQIGNPTGSGLVRVSEDANAFATLANAAFLQTIDDMNMGDYAYSRVESRVTTDRACQNQAGSQLSLVDKAESVHSVIDESEAWYAKSELSIKRSYQDAWTQENKLLTCDSGTRAVRFNYERLQQGSIVLKSVVDEDLTRVLTMTEKKLNQPIQHTMALKKTGERTLAFVNYIENGNEVLVDAELSNNVTSTLSMKNADGEVETAQLQLQDRFPLELAITLDKTQQWTRYRIASGQQDFLVPETGETMRLEFRNLIFSRDNGCVPISGQMAASVGDLRYSIAFQPKGPLLMKREGSNDSILLAPFACVLKER